MLICLGISLYVSSHAQENELIFVKAGTRILDYFPDNVRYRYTDFTFGKVVFTNGTINSAKLNYNLLSAEMEFLQGKDTLSILRKKEIDFISIAQDTFYFENGYLEQIACGPFKIGLKQYIKLNKILKKDSYGTRTSGSDKNSYGWLPADGNFHKLTANEDMVYQKTQEYYLSDQSRRFVQFRKKNVLKLFPDKNSEVQNYIKSNQINFDSENDLLKLAGYLRSL